jgi:hypothetical protein
VIVVEDTETGEQLTVDSSDADAAPPLSANTKAAMTSGRAARVVRTVRPRFVSLRWLCG